MIDIIPEGIPVRRKNRIFAVQCIYALAINKSDGLFSPEDTVENFAEKFFPGDEKLKFGKELAIGIIENMDVIDDLIKEYSTHWSIDRIAATDLAILRVAIYEMLFREDVPPIVAINEAIDIGKIMSTDESNRFLNGVLDGVKKKLKRPLREPGNK